MRITIAEIRGMKERGEKIPMVTAYDYVTAKIADAAGAPMILVGDSLGMVVLGYESTIPVTLEEMLHHTRAAARGAKNALVVGDMPFMTYQGSVPEALHNAARFIQEAGAQAVKLEGGETIAETVKRLVECGIPVMGHLGLTPQSIHQLSGFKVQGKTLESARKLIMDALALEKAGAFSIVLECVPTPLSERISRKLAIPTIGIGAGPGCDGQVQVISDLLGLYTDFVPRHAKQYAHLAGEIGRAVGEYCSEVKSGDFPTSKQSFAMEEGLLKVLDRSLGEEAGGDL